MKKIYILSLLLILTSNNIFSQNDWNLTFQSNPYSIQTMKYIDSNIIMAFSQNDNYLKSTDKGNTWLVYLAFDSVYGIFDFQFINSYTGWCVGGRNITYGGAIFKTTNQGVNWVKQSYGNISDFWYSINFVDSLNGWIVGERGKILKTTDGGINWVQITVENVRLRNVDFANSSTGWIVGIPNYLKKTTNGGVNWIAQSYPNNCGYFQFTSIYVIDPLNCFILGSCSGEGYLYKTTNGGENWLQLYGPGNNLYKVFFKGDIGFICGSASTILKTTNLGLNWSTINLGSYINVASVAITDTNIWVAGGYSSWPTYYNSILKTTNLGENWISSYYGKHLRFYDISFINKDTGLAVGQDGFNYITHNGGINWSLFKPNTDFYYQAKLFPSGNGFIFGGNGYIYKTSNHGINWREVSFTQFLNYSAIYFLNEDTGWAAADYGKIAKTTNKGENWNFTTINPPYKLTSINFINQQTGWAVGNYTYGNPWSYFHSVVLKTTNGGTIWDTVLISSAVHYKQIQFVDSLNGYLAKIYGAIMKTTNGGETWFETTPAYYNLHSFNMFNKEIGWLLGSYSNGESFVMKTTDSGDNWHTQFTKGYGDFQSIDILDSSRIWLVGWLSGIYKSTNGGGIIIGIEPSSSLIPQYFFLHQNYPNPFNPITKIKFDIPKLSNAKIIIYDLLGREITTLVNEQLKPGSYEVDWDGSSFASGVYFYQLVVGDNTNNGEGYIETKRMVLIK